MNDANKAILEFFRGFQTCNRRERIFNRKFHNMGLKEVDSVDDINEKFYFHESWSTRFGDEPPRSGQRYFEANDSAIEEWMNMRNCIGKKHKEALWCDSDKCSDIKLKDK